MTLPVREKDAPIEARRSIAKRQTHLFLVLFITAAALSQASEPKGIESYFIRLPEDSTFLEGKPDQLLGYIRRGQGTVDIKNGYLFLRGDGAQVSLQIALFRYKDGSPLLAVSYGELEQTDFTRLAFFIEKDGNMTPTEAVSFPVSPNGKFVYELPHYGRVITVKDEAGKLVARVRFDGERFVSAEGNSASEASTPMRPESNASDGEETVRMGRVQVIGKISREQDPNQKATTHILNLDKPLKIAALDPVSQIRLIPGNEAQRKELENLPEGIFKNTHFIFLGTLKEDSGFKRLSLTIVKYKPIGL
ncbi:MAG: hypothetical protein ABI787_03025 [Spartobacteria bacterium]